MDFGGRSISASSDIQWQESEYGVLPRFVADSTSSFRNVSEVRSRLQQNQGFACFRGARTGYSCGKVDSINYRPPAAACAAGSCASNWSYLAPTPLGGSPLACGVSDSGGPVFLTTRAYGSFTGAFVNPSNYRDCGGAWYMPAEWFPAYMNARVIVAP